MIFRGHSLLQIILLTVTVVLTTGCEEEFPPSEFETGQIYLGSSYEIQVTSSNAYVTTNDGMAIINIEDPTKPQMISLFKAGGTAFGLYVDDDLGFVGSGSAEDNLSIVDLRDKHNPVIMASLNLSGAVHCMDKVGNLLYCGTTEGRFYIIDVSDPARPMIISSLQCQGRCLDLVVYQNLAFIANPEKGLQIVDISDSDTSIILESLREFVGAWDIHLTDGYLLLGKHGNGFSIFRIEKDNSLSHLVSNSSGGEVYGIFKEGNFMYIADLQDGVEIWDLSSISQPILLQTIDEYSPHDLTALNHLIYLADQDRHFVIIER